MAINKTLEQLLGPGTTQTADSVTILKANLKSEKIPPAFEALVASADNTAESILAALILKVRETQDTSPDAELAIFFDPTNGTDAQLVSIVSDGITNISEQYIITVRILNKRATAQMSPNPNKI